MVLFPQLPKVMNSNFFRCLLQDRCLTHKPSIGKIDNSQWYIAATDHLSLFRSLLPSLLTPTAYKFEKLFHLITWLNFLENQPICEEANNLLAMETSSRTAKDACWHPWFISAELRWCRTASCSKALCPDNAALSSFPCQRSQGWRVIGWVVAPGLVRCSHTSSEPETYPEHHSLIF